MARKGLVNPTDEIKNAIELFIDVVGIPQELVEFDMRGDDCDLTNLETLEINENNDEGLSSKDVVPFLLRFKKLKKLVIQHLEIDIDYLLDIIRYLVNMKTQKISVSLWVINSTSFGVNHELDEEETKDIFNKTLEMVKEKFPFPDGRILELHIYEFNGNRYPNHSIIYGERGAMLTINDVMSDTSDSESDTSGSMDEGNESSDDMDESVENSDTEDMNVQE